MANSFPKAAEAVLEWYFDWKALTNGSGATNWLADGETITSYEVVVPVGLTLDSHASINGATVVRAWLSGGVDGQDYRVTCRITTSAGRTDERSMRIRVRPR